MAGMIPDKKTIQEIEQEYEQLRSKHNQLVEDWFKSRFDVVEDKDHSQTCKSDQKPSLFI